MAKVTVIVPAKDEEATIGEVLRGVKPFAGQIIVVDGNSRDKTAQIARAAGAEVVSDHDLGKGDAVRSAIPHIRGDIAVFIDADGSHEPEDIPKLVKPIAEGRADHVTASRLMGGSSELHGAFDEFLRLSGSAFITTLINKRFKVRLSDSQNGFRAIRTDVLRRLDLRENITTIEQEMIIKTLKKGFLMDEAPSHENARKSGKSHLRLSRIWLRYGWSLIKYLYLQ